MQQVHDKQHRDNAGGNTEQLVGEVEPGPVASDRSVQYRVLGRERTFDGEVIDQVEQGTDAARAEADSENDPDLDHQQPAPPWRHRAGAVALARLDGQGYARVHSAMIPTKAEVALKSGLQTVPRPVRHLHATWNRRAFR